MVITSTISGNSEYYTLKASGVVGVCSHLAVHFDESLHEDCIDLAFVECILEAIPECQQWHQVKVPEEENQRKRFASFMRAGRSCKGKRMK
jgi:hypothetical protein